MKASTIAWLFAALWLTPVYGQGADLSHQCKQVLISVHKLKPLYYQAISQAVEQGDISEQTVNSVRAADNNDLVLFRRNFTRACISEDQSFYATFVSTFKHQFL